MWALTCDKVKLPPTDAKCVDFTYDNKKWQYFAGPIEEDSDTDAHQHCGIRCLEFSVSKSCARRAISHITEQPEEVFEDQYFKKVDTTWARYLAYAFKGRTTAVDASLRVAAQKIISRGAVPNKRTMQRELVEEYGVDYYNKRLKSNLDTYLTTDGLIDNRGAITKEICTEKNKKAFEESFSILQHQIAKALKRNQVSTTWKKTEGLFDNMDVTMQQKFIEMLCLLPICTKRCPVQPDHLPSLYFWGKPNTGKSAFFDSGVFLKKFAQDSSGVSRFKLNSTHSGILFDDIPLDFLDRPDVSGTIRQMALGGNAVIKVFGDTDNVCGYCVVTSNNKPSFFEKVPPPDVKIDIGNWDRNCDAWKRRFIVLEFSDFIDADPINVVWADYNIRQHAAELCYRIVNKLRDYNSALFDSYLTDIHDVLQKDYNVEDKQDIEYKDVDPDSVNVGKTVTLQPPGPTDTPNSRNPFAVKPENNKPPGRISFMKRCGECYWKFRNGLTYPLWGNCTACMEL